MVLDALRAYLQLASGVTEVPRQRAVAAARSLLPPGAGVDPGASGQLQHQVAAIAEELMVASRANRELLLGVVHTEVERALGRLGIASADDVDALRHRVERLERLVRSQQSSPERESETTTPARAAKRSRAITPAAAPAAQKSARTARKTSAAKTASSAKTVSTPKTASSAKTTSTAKTTQPGGAVISGTSPAGGRRASRPGGEAVPTRSAGEGPATTGEPATGPATGAATGTATGDDS